MLKTEGYLCAHVYVLQNFTFGSVHTMGQDVLWFADDFVVARAFMCNLWCFFLRVLRSWASYPWRTAPPASLVRSCVVSCIRWIKRKLPCASLAQCEPVHAMASTRISLQTPDRILTNKLTRGIIGATNVRTPTLWFV